MQQHSVEQHQMHFMPQQPMQQQSMQVMPQQTQPMQQQQGQQQQPVMPLHQQPAVRMQQQAMMRPMMQTMQQQPMMQPMQQQAMQQPVQPMQQVQQPMTQMQVQQPMMQMQVQLPLMQMQCAGQYLQPVQQQIPEHPMQGYSAAQTLALACVQTQQSPMMEASPRCPKPCCNTKSEESESTRDSADGCTDSVSDTPSELPERPQVAEDLARVISSLAQGSVAHVLESLTCFARPERAQDFALALYSAAEPELVRPVGELVAALLPHFAQLAQKIWEYCKEDLPFIASESPPARAHGTVLLAAELFARGLLTMGVAKELFAGLLFGEFHPEDHAVSLACHAFLVAGPILDRSHLGMKMVEYIVLRLKEVKGLNLTIATRKSITEVVELQKNRWDAEEAARAALTNKNSGQKKAKTAARVRARTLIERTAEGADAWTGLRNDERALTSLLEMAAAGDSPAISALATAPEDLHDTLQVVATPSTLPLVLALRGQ